MHSPDYLARWRSEKTAAFLARIIAAREQDPTRRALFRRLSEESETQAGIIASKEAPPAFTPSFRARTLAVLVSTLGPQAMRPA